MSQNDALMILGVAALFTAAVGAIITTEGNTNTGRKFFWTAGVLVMTPLAHVFTKAIMG